MLLLATLLTADPAHAGHEHSSSSHVRPAEQGSVRIDNTTRKTLNIWCDGEFLAAVGSGRTILRLPEGRIDLVARTSDRVVDTVSVTVRSDRQVSWNIDRPTSGVLVVENPLPIDVLVELPDGRSRRVEAYGSLRWAGMDLGDCDIVVRRVGGEFLQRRSVTIGAWDDTELRVKKPAAGMLLVSNPLPHSIAVYVDGRKKATIAAYGTKVLYLSPGDARVDLVEPGRYGGRLKSRVVDIDRYDMARLSSETAVASSTCHRRPR